MSSIVALSDHVGPDWGLLAWAVGVVIVLALLIVLLKKLGKPIPRRRRRAEARIDNDAV